MPADGDAPRGRRAIGKGRMEAFSDGVFAFAATLLGVDLAVHPPGTPLQQVFHEWPGYLASPMNPAPAPAGSGINARPGQHAYPHIGPARRVPSGPAGR